MRVRVKVRATVRVRVRVRARVRVVVGCMVLRVRRAVVRYRGDMGEVWGRYGGDMGEISLEIGLPGRGSR